jgi:hypothetical protein
MMVDSPRTEQFSQDDLNHEPQLFYTIKVLGQLNCHWEDWFEGMKMKNKVDEASGVAYTVISGPVPDQVALHGLLIKIRDLNLTLISVNCRAQEKSMPD